MGRYTGILGLLTMLGLAFTFSTNRRAIRLKTVVFTIDEFGTTRQDSLVLGDSTKVRGK